MTEKGEKLSKRLTKVRKNIEDTKRLVAYHKKMLKIYLRKEAELMDKIEKEQLNDLFRTVKEKGCDIAAINEAVNNGEFSAAEEEIVNSDVKDTSVCVQNSNSDFHTKNREDKH
ncbi:MAG: hypothetical protein IK999_11955 [Ruminococcus sp.]|nr:hypothetical protein [Ruminococcus sp.]